MYTVEFPGLWGLKFDINPVALQLGRISIYWYGIIIAFGFMLAVFLGMRHSKNFGIDPENIIDLVLWAAPAAIIGARLYYVVFSWENYINNPLDILKIWHGGLAIYGGILAAFIVAYIFAKRKNIGVLKLFDFGVPYLVLAQAIGRWGNFINQEAYGTNTLLPWGMTSERIRGELSILEMQGFNVSPEIPVHPTFLYESLWNLGAFLLLMWFRKRKKVDGEVFFLYMIVYGLGRSWIEALRTDSLMLGNLRISQVLAVVFVIAFGAVFYIRRKKLEDREVTVAGSSEYGSVLMKLKEDDADTASTQVEGGKPAVDENSDDTQIPEEINDVHTEESSTEYNKEEDADEDKKNE